MTTTYLITGANRGIGRGLTDLILQRPDTRVIGLVRNPEDETSKSLAASSPDPKRLLILPYDAKDPNSASSAISTLETTHEVKHLDVVIANAGALLWHGPAVDTPGDAILDSITVNTIGPLLLFRACLPLMQASPAPKFIAISSAIGSTGQIPQFKQSQTLPYGVSKAALNHTFRKLSVDHPEIVIELLTPGPVLTDLMRVFQAGFEERVKKDPNLLKRFTPIDQVCDGLMSQIDSASMESSGEFRDWKGEVVPW
ncbi:toxin biosynthesis ketoreductase [Exophiala viscosa]|uniref:Toxin biosynthesis ketoreductase n=1 Tax=Exophiala viscosa TaxID=2486360 RepID=A0AAN6DV04_9EURO|nr:toxin biosynthesis ketoreductase [Exophiala viscosa]KAI1626176.1 toxin biosynthesis ketoreductase [Exophiala viscosa]